MTFIKVEGCVHRHAVLEHFPEDPSRPSVLKPFPLQALRPPATVNVLSASARGSAGYCVARAGLLPVFVPCFIETLPGLFIGGQSAATFSQQPRH